MQAKGMVTHHDHTSPTGPTQLCHSSALHCPQRKIFYHLYQQPAYVLHAPSKDRTANWSYFPAGPADKQASTALARIEPCAGTRQGASQ